VIYDQSALKQKAGKSSLLFVLFLNFEKAAFVFIETVIWILKKMAIFKL